MLMDGLGQVSSSKRQPGLHQAVCGFLKNISFELVVKTTCLIYVQLMMLHQPNSDAKMTKQLGLRSSCRATLCIRYWLVVRLLLLRLSLRACALK